MRWLPLLMACLLLPGCSDNGGGQDCPPGEDCDVLPPVTDTTGFIRGVVVDASIVPMAGVRVSLAGNGADAVNTTDSEGRFIFPDLAGGFYTLRIEKPGFQPVQQQAEVVAGDATPAAVRVVLQAIPGYNPYFMPLNWEGYIQCNTNYVNVCLIVNYYPQALLGIGPLLEDTSIKVWYHEFVDQGVSPDHVQVETVWKETQQLGDSLMIRYEVGDLESVTIPCVFGTQRGVSPLVYRINASMAQDAGLGAPDPAPDDDGCNEETAWGFAMEFFAGDALRICQPTPAGCLPQFGLVLEQETQTFIRAFYGYAPPEDWVFIDQGEYPPPA